MQKNTKANFLVKYNRQIEVVTVDQKDRSDYYRFRDIVKTRLSIDKKFKTFFYLEGDGLTGTVPFDPSFYDEILKNIGEFGSDNLISIRVHTVHSFVFAANLPSITSIVQPQVPKEEGKAISLGKMAQIKKAEEIREETKVKDEVQEEVDEWQDIVETNVDDEGKQTKTITSATCTITIGDPVKKAVVAKPQPKKVQSEPKMEEREVSPPKFGAEVSTLRGYITSTKFAADMDLYEKNGPTGATSENQVKIQVEVNNTGTEKLNKTFGVYQIKGDSSLTKIPLPVIRPGKKKIVTIKLEFDKFSTTGVSLLCLGYEEAGQNRYFGKILKVDFKKFEAFAKMKFVSDKHAVKSLSGQGNSSGDPMSANEIKKAEEFVKKLNAGYKARTQYDSTVYNQFRDVRKKLPNVDKYTLCEYIKSNQIPRYHLLKYADNSPAFKRIFTAKDSMTKTEIDMVKKFLDGLDFKALSSKRYGGNLFSKFRQIRDKIPNVNKPATCELINSNIIPFNLLLKYAGDSKALYSMLRQWRNYN